MQCSYVDGYNSESTAEDSSPKFRIRLYVPPQMAELTWVHPPLFFQKLLRFRTSDGPRPFPQIVFPTLCIIRGRVLLIVFSVRPLFSAPSLHRRLFLLRPQFAVMQCCPKTFNYYPTSPRSRVKILLIYRNPLLPIAKALSSVDFPTISSFEE